MCYTSKRIAIIFLCLVFLLTNPISVSAQPSTLGQKREEADRVRGQLQNIDADLDVTVERYNQATINLNQTEKKIKQINKDLDKTSNRFSHQKKLLSRRLVHIYKNGNIDLLSTLLGTRDFNNFLTRVFCLIQITNQDVSLLEEMQNTKAQFEATKGQLEREERVQRALATEFALKRNEIEKQVGERRAFLSTVETEIQEIINEEEEREAQAQAEEVRRLQQQQVQNRQDSGAVQNNPNQSNPADQTNPGQTTPNNGQNNDNSQGNEEHNDNDTEKPKESPAPKPAPSKSAHSEVVSIAMQHLGKPYQWGGAGPDSFDCSGLVMYCYSQIGISLPHSAAAQYNHGIRLSREQMEPGDLVFFGKTGVTHVGIYAGGGKYIHAPRTGDVVKVSALSSRNDYYGACRP